MGKAKSEKLSNRWTTEEVNKLKRLAAIGLGSADIQARMPKRTRTAITNKATAEMIQLDPNRICDIRSFGEKGGVFLREELGGVVGIRWGCAHRSGGTFSPDLCDGLMQEKVLVPAPRLAEGHYVWSAKPA